MIDLADRPPEQPTPLRLTLNGLLLLSVVIAITTHTHQVIIPLFLGLFTWLKVWGKVWLKALTPKLALLLAKNSLVIQTRQIFVKASTHLIFKSHRPWRRWLANRKQALVDLIKRLFAGFLRLPLWVRTTLALLLLLATAGSSFAIFALLVIPQPVMNWLQQKVMTTLNKLGVTRFFSALWRFVVPATVRHRWQMYVKWNLGRRQVRAARRVHEKVTRSEQTSQQLPPSDAKD